jgi:superfamily II DNA or RNA helicase
MRPFVYQGFALDALAAARKRGQKRALLVMATGLGKTVVSGFDLERLLREDPGRVLFLSHDTRINAQARKTYEKMLGKKYTHGNFNGKEKHLHRVDILYATLQTMANWRESFDPHEFKYIVLDEAHHGEAATFKPTLEYFQPDFFLAVTATPERGDNKDITEFFGEPVYRLGVFEALARGYLCHVDYRLMTDEIQNLEVLDTPVGKLSIAELNRTVFIPKRDEEIARIIAEKTKDIKSPRVMIFCSSIEHAERMAALMPHAAVLHSKMKDKKEVERRLEAFRTGEISTVLTVDMLNEGIDVPEANVLVFLRSTSSRTIFLQQLGRGLRKLLGKIGVLVLDFVANCERIEMVDWLMEGVKQELARTIQDRLDAGEIGDDGGSIGDVIDLHLEGVEFDERLLRLQAIVHEVKDGYTAELLIEQLQVLAKAHGISPTVAIINENSKAGLGASITVFINVFGSLNKALEAAGLPVSNIRAYDKAVLIQQLQQLAATIGRTPTEKDVRKHAKDGHGPGLAAFLKSFGIFEAAIVAAGLGTSKKGEAMLQLIELVDTVGRALTTREVDEYSKHGQCRRSSVLASYFGSFNRALELAGASPARQKHSKERMIAQLQGFAREHGRPPSIREVKETSKKSATAASYTTLVSSFGSYEAAIKAAGLIRKAAPSYSREELIGQLRELGSRLGRPPTYTEVEKCGQSGEIASIAVFKRRFGSFRAALRAAGFSD